MEQENKCSYGCDQQAHHLLKNGKWCCLPTRQSCPAVRARNAQSVKKSYQNGRVTVLKQYGGWNKGLTKETSEKVRQYADTIRKGMADGTIVVNMMGKHHTDETKKKLSLNGGYRKGSGRGKNGWYKGYWCDSSWELAWVIYQLDHGLPFTRNLTGFEYEYEGRMCRYYPDFILEDGSYVEIKGWLDTKNKAKIASFSGVLVILGVREIKPYIEYVIARYGKNYISLYDGYAKPERRKTSCPSCGSEYAGWGRVCISCYANSRRTVERPSKEELKSLVLALPMTKIGKMFSVSDSTIRSWCLSYGIVK